MRSMPGESNEQKVSMKNVLAASPERFPGSCDGYRFAEWDFIVQPGEHHARAALTEESAHFHEEI